MATQILTVDFFLSRENYPRTRLVIDSIAQSQGHVMKNQKVPQFITLALIFIYFSKWGIDFAVDIFLTSYFQFGKKFNSFDIVENGYENIHYKINHGCIMW